MIDAKVITARHQKQLAVMRGWLDGKGYYVAMDAMELVRSLETGLRKDGKTPAFHHQLSVAQLLTTLISNVKYPEETIAVAFLHDIIEDHGDVWTREALQERFGSRISDAVWKVSKKTVGVTKTYEHYFSEMGTCPIASLVKLSDRAHNIYTMLEVFTPVKQVKYVNEVDQWFYPMLKTARRAFPQQYPTYENLKILLLCQCQLVRQIHGA